MKGIYEEDAARYARFVDLLIAGLDEPIGLYDEMLGLINDEDFHKPLANETEIQRLPS